MSFLDFAAAHPVLAVIFAALALCALVVGIVVAVVSALIPWPKKPEPEVVEMTPAGAEGARDVKSEGSER